MAKGELIVESESSTPEIVDSWLLDRKTHEISNWLLDNFEAEGEADFDFFEWDNSDELEESQEIAALPLRLILMDNFGNRLTALEFEAIFHQLREKFGNDWVPNGKRVEVAELEDDEEEDQPVFSSFSGAKDRIPELLRYLDDVTAAFYPHLGHNRPPEDLQITALEIEDIKRLLLEAELIPDEIPENRINFLADLGARLFNLGKDIVTYLGKKGDIFIDKFVASAGENAGKWATRAIPILYAGHLFKDFGETLVRLVAGQ